MWERIKNDIRRRDEGTILGLDKRGKKFEYTKPWNTESDFIVDEVCVRNIANQCKKAIENAGMIIRTRCNCVGCQMQPDFLPLLFNPSINCRFYYLPHLNYHRQ